MSLSERSERAILPTYPERRRALVRGAGCTVWDDAGRAYLDMVAGLAVCSLGHGHPVAAQALAEQAATLGHVSNLFYSEPQVALAERLCSLSGFEQAFFCNSGAEAVEAAIKLARRAGGAGKHEIICLEGAFHGRTLATLAAGWSEAKREPVRPVPGGVSHVPRNDADALRAAVTGSTAAVLIEPVQGEGGVWPIDHGYLQLARELCDAHGALLLYDEVQAGIGRCGRWFAFELSGVRPDAIALAKGLAGGLPIGALLAHGGFERGDHATTFGGSPPIAASALAVLTAIEREQLVENAETMGARLRERVTALDGVESVRGAGLLLGVELDGTPSATVAEALAADGVLVNAITATALRLCPPLCLSAHDVEHFCRALESALVRCRGITVSTR